MARGGNDGGNGNPLVLESFEGDVGAPENDAVDLTGIHFIDDERDVKEALAILNAQPAVGIDIETPAGEGSGPHSSTISTLQIGFDLDHMFVFDMYAMQDPAVRRLIFRMLRRPDQRHIAHYMIVEQPWLLYHFGVRIGMPFDTEAAEKDIRRFEDPKAATRYGEVVLRYEGVHVDKDEQTSDWGRRPLTDRQKRYGGHDVAHLVSIAEKQEAKLREYGIWDKFVEKCNQRYATSLATIHTMDRYDDDDYLRVQGMIARAGSVSELQRLWSLIPRFTLAHHHRNAVQKSIQEHIARRRR